MAFRSALLFALLLAGPAWGQTIPQGAPPRSMLGGTPSVSSCGTSPSVVGNDATGLITVGSGVVTACTLTFSRTYTTAPVCVAVASLATVTLGATTSTTAITFGMSLTLGGGTIRYLCDVP
jgi:hypothetical protein